MSHEHVRFNERGILLEGESVFVLAQDGQFYYGQITSYKIVPLFRGAWHGYEIEGDEKGNHVTAEEANVWSKWDYEHDVHLGERLNHDLTPEQIFDVETYITAALNNIFTPEES